MDGSTLGKRRDTVGAEDGLASWGEGVVVSITKESRGGGAVVNLVEVLGSSVVLGTFRAATLASNQLKAAVFGRRRRSRESSMVEAV